jgi:signal transduction histidine kinase/ligand-binding sensor domain-containing protein
MHTRFVEYCTTRVSLFYRRVSIPALSRLAPVIPPWLCAVSFTSLSSLSLASDWSIRAWRLELPEQTVAGVAQLPDGHLWLATPSNVVRFDGNSFESFGVARIVGRKEDISNIRKMLPSRSGGMWLAMEKGGLVHLRDGWSQVMIDNLPQSNPQSLIEDEDGSLWLTSLKGTVHHICNGKAVTLDLDPSLSGKSPCSMARDGKGRIWFVKGNKGGVVKGGKFEVRFSVPGVENCVASSREGGVWVCSDFHLFKYDEEGGLIDHKTPEPKHCDAQPLVLLEDEISSRVWIGTKHGGLFLYDGSRFENLPTSRPQIVSLAQDLEGSLWAGTSEGGMMQVRPRVVRLEGSTTALSFESFASLAEDTNGTLWAVTGDGSLIYRQGAEWMPSPVALPGRVACVAADREGGIWIGNRYRKLHHLKDGHLSTWGPEEGFKALRVRALFVDRDGVVWIATEGNAGLACLRSGKFTTIRLGTEVRTITCMTEDNAGNKWVATGSGDLFRVSNEEVTNERERASTLRTWIRDVRASADGAIWICYRNAGIGRLKEGKFFNITRAGGLYEDAVNQMLFDDEWVWFSGEHGIFKVRQKELEDVANGAAPRVQSVYYGTGDGVVKPQSPFGPSSGALRSLDGRLWMPMFTALAIIYPKNGRDNFTPPDVFVKRVRVDDKAAAEYGTLMPTENVPDLSRSATPLQLLPDHRNLQFDFTALSFAAPQNVCFQYRLEGLDHDWIDAGTHRQARYSHLPAGNYRFCVKACNSNGIWNKEGAALAFMVAPFYWQTWWFRAGTLAAFAVLIALGVRYVSFRRLRTQVRLLQHQTALAKEKARIARDLHDDLGSRLTKIVLLNELTRHHREKPEKVEAHAQQSLVMARQAIKSLDETVWAVNPRNDTLAHLMNYIGEYAVEYLQTAGIRCRVDLLTNPPQRLVPSEVRHNLFLAIKEALNNIVRHANASEVRLHAGVTSDSFSIIIEDDGRGFGDVMDNAFADGLRNMRQRMNEIQGEFQIDSHPGSGTSVHLLYPWPAQS